MLKKILIGILALIAIFCAYVATLPDNYRIERSLLIEANAAQLFEQVNDLQNFNTWSPWAKLDPNSKAEFSTPSLGKGASLAWAGNHEVGKGKMTIIESTPNDRVRMRLDFKEPMEDTATAEFLFKAEGDATKITWAILGKDTFLSKVICLFMDRDKMIGDMFEKGLSNLKNKVTTSS